MGPPGGRTVSGSARRDRTVSGAARRDRTVSGATRRGQNGLWGRPAGTERLVGPPGGTERLVGPPGGDRTVSGGRPVGTERLVWPHGGDRTVSGATRRGQNGLWDCNPALTVVLWAAAGHRHRTVQWWSWANISIFLLDMRSELTAGVSVNSELSFILMVLQYFTLVTVYIIFVLFLPSTFLQPFLSYHVVITAWQRQCE